MSVMELTRFGVVEGSVDAFLLTRAGAERALRREHPGLVSMTLVRLDANTWVDLVEWRDQESADGAARSAHALPEVATMLSMIASVESMEFGTVMGDSAHASL